MEPLQAAAQKMARPELRSNSLADYLSRLARFACAIAVLFAGFRFRWSLYELRLPPVYADYTDGLLFLSDLFLLITLAAWGASLIIQPRRLEHGPAFLSLPLAGLILTAAVSIPFSALPILSFYHLMRLALMAGLYLFIVNQHIRIGQLIWAVAAGVFIQAGVGLTQWLTQADLGLQGLGEYELDPAWSGVSIVWSEAGRSLRAYGLTDHPNILGGILVCSLILMLGWRIGVARPGRIQTIADGVFILGIGGIFVTFSRSAWLGLAAALVVGAGFLVWTQRRSALLDGAAVMSAGAVLLFPLIWSNLPILGVRLGAHSSFTEVPYEKSSINERAALNQTANEIFAANAFTGVGVGAYVAALRSEQPDFPFFYQPPHLALLAAAVEIGLFGALFYSLAIGGPIAAVALIRRKSSLSLELITAFCLLIALAVIGLFDYYPWLLAPGRFWQWLGWGLWAAAYHNHARNLKD